MTYSGGFRNISRYCLKYFTTGCPSSKYMVYAAACVCRELYEKITDRKKKLCQNKNKVFLLQICRKLVAWADFKSTCPQKSNVGW